MNFVFMSYKENINPEVDISNTKYMIMSQIRDYNKIMSSPPPCHQALDKVACHLIFSL